MPQALWAEVPETESQINLSFFEGHCVKCFVIVIERLNSHQEMCPELVGRVPTEWLHDRKTPLWKEGGAR